MAKSLPLPATMQSNFWARISVARKDGTGKVYGPELYAAAQKPDGQITEVSYMFPRPGADKTPVPKVSFVTKAGDLGCGVGYYK